MADAGRVPDVNGERRLVRSSIGLDEAAGRLPWLHFRSGREPRESQSLRSASISCCSIASRGQPGGGRLPRRWSLAARARSAGRYEPCSFGVMRFRRVSSGARNTGSAKSESAGRAAIRPALERVAAGRAAPLGGVEVERARGLLALLGRQSFGPGVVEQNLAAFQIVARDREQVLGASGVRLRAGRLDDFGLNSSSSEPLHDLA